MEVKELKEKMVSLRETLEGEKPPEGNGYYPIWRAQLSIFREIADLIDQLPEPSSSKKDIKSKHQYISCSDLTNIIYKGHTNPEEPNWATFQGCVVTQEKNIFVVWHLKGKYFTDSAATFVCWYNDHSAAIERAVADVMAERKLTGEK